MYFYTYKFIYIMWNILHLSAFLLVVPTIFYQCTDNASGTLRQFPESQNYRNICRRVRIGKGAATLITLLYRKGESNYWFNSHTVTTTDSPFYGSVISQDYRNICRRVRRGEGAVTINYRTLLSRKREEQLLI